MKSSMDRQFIRLAFLSALFFIAGISSSYYYKSKNKTGEHASKINTYISKSIKEFNDFCKIFAEENPALSSPANHLNNDKVGNLIESYYNKPYSICLYVNDSLILWTNPDIAPLQKPVSREFENRLVKLKNGFYVINEYTFPISYGHVKALLYIPIKYHFDSDSKLFTDYFPASESISGNTIIQLDPTPFPIIAPNGTTLGHLQDLGKYSDRGTQLSLLFLILGFIILAILINRIAWMVKELTSSPLTSAIFLFISISIFRFILAKSGIILRFNQLIYPDGLLPSDLQNTLGDILINIILLFWLLLVTYKNLHLVAFDHIKTSGKVFIASANYLATMVGMLMIIDICRNLVLFSGIDFDFENVFNTNAESLLSLVGVILVLFIFFIVSHRMSVTVKLLKLKSRYKLMSILLAFTLIWPIFYSNHPGFSPALLYLGAFIYIILFDMFTDENKATIFWLLVWLLIFSGFSSVLLYNYSKDKEVALRRNVALALAEPVDQMLNKKINESFARMPTQPDLREAVLSCDNETEVCYELEYLLSNFFIQSQYIADYYEVEVEAAVIKSASFKESFEISPEKGKLHSYTVKTYLDSVFLDQPISLKINFNRNVSSDNRDFSSLIHSINFKDISALQNYSYAIYLNDTLMESKGRSYKKVLQKEPLPLQDAYIEAISSDRTELYFNAGNNKIILVGRPLSGLIKPISLFSFLFALLVIFIVLLSWLNSRFKFLPQSLNLHIERPLSLQNKIQFSVIALIVFSFVCVGIVTVYYFNNTSEQNDHERLINKAISVQSDVEIKIQAVDNISNALGHLLPQLSRIHQTDITLYDSSGKLMHSTDSEIYSMGFIAPMINPVARARLNNNETEIYINPKERIGKYTYKSAFVQFRVNNQVAGYIQVPYSGKTDLDKNSVRGFMGTLLNVYIFLLIISGAIAIGVSNSITKPIRDLGEKLKIFKLGRKNEPLYWENKDELGELIRQYNSMITSLEKSAELLAQNEREVAWREMAKQVAHEIKNPLTPMKLSIQHLENKISSLSSEELQPFVKRVSQTLIEQIDNLTRIASEFSNFSKLPEPDNEKIILNDLISSVHDLFRKREDIIFNLYVPIDEIYIFADKSHILRILNNLIKNAIQAIPEDRKGKLDIKLFTRRGFAVVQVSDNGMGIPVEMQDKVFYPNFTTKSSGTGLGLAICKDMAEAYGGKIYFNTRPSEGTDFFFELPLYNAKSTEINQL